MSYSRWSTTIGFDYEKAFTGMDHVDQVLAFVQMDQPARDRLLKSQRGYFSSWYIYWTVGSDDSLGRKGQLLWIGSNRARMCDWRTYSYDYLKEVCWRGRWNDIPGYAQCQDQRDCFNLAEAVRDWLADVEDSFPESADDAC